MAKPTTKEGSMGVRITISGTLSTLVLLSSIGTLSAFAQQARSQSDDVPSFTQDASDAPHALKTAPIQSTKAPVVLQPLAPPTVVGNAAPITGPAQVIPPAPRIVTRTAGTLVLPQQSLGGVARPEPASTH